LASSLIAPRPLHQNWIINNREKADCLPIPDESELCWDRRESTEDSGQRICDRDYSIDESGIDESGR